MGKNFSPKNGETNGLRIEPAKRRKGGGLQFLRKKSIKKRRIKTFYGKGSGKRLVFGELGVGKRTRQSLHGGF